MVFSFYPLFDKGRYKFDLPLLVCGATQDVGMPLAGLREFESAASVIYRASGAGDRFRLFVDEGPHAMSMSAFETASTWLGKHL